MVLAINNLEFFFPEAKVSTHFSIEQGKTIALMGPSGSGKTTILNLIAGFLKPSAGDIRFNEVSLLPLKPSQRPLTYLFQAHNLFPHLNVWQNLALGISPNLIVSPAQKMQIRQALESVELTGFDKRYPLALSGGQQQRIALARCILRAKPILLLDEPFSALDQQLRNEMMALILDIQRQKNLIVVLATHQLEDAKSLSATIVSLKATIE